MSMTERELYLARKLVRLEGTLELMRSEAAYRQITNDPNWSLYSCAAECVEKELIKAKKAVM